MRDTTTRDASRVVEVDIVPLKKTDGDGAARLTCQRCGLCKVARANNGLDRARALALFRRDCPRREDNAYVEHLRP